MRANGEGGEEEKEDWSKSGRGGAGEDGTGRVRQERWGVRSEGGRVGKLGVR